MYARLTLFHGVYKLGCFCRLQVPKTMFLMTYLRSSKGVSDLCKEDTVVIVDTVVMVAQCNYGITRIIT